MREPQPSDEAPSRRVCRIPENPRHIVAAILAVYFLLVLRWYPGTVDGQLCFQEPLRVARFGFKEVFPRPDGRPTVCEREVWPALLALPIGVLFYVLFAYAGPRVLRSGLRNLRRAFAVRKQFTSICLRGAFLLATLNMARLPVNYAVGHILPTADVHNIIECGLFPVSLCINLVYLLSFVLVRFAGAFVNPWLVYTESPVCPPHPWRVVAHDLPRYAFDGVWVEIARFLILVVLTGILVGLLARLSEKYPRVSRVLCGCLCVLLAAAAVVGIVSPRLLR